MKYKKDLWAMVEISQSHYLGLAPTKINVLCLVAILDQLSPEEETNEKWYLEVDV